MDQHVYRHVGRHGAAHVSCRCRVGIVSHAMRLCALAACVLPSCAPSSMCAQLQHVRLPLHAACVRTLCCPRPCICVSSHAAWTAPFRKDVLRGAPSPPPALAATADRCSHLASLIRFKLWHAASWARAMGFNCGQPRKMFGISGSVCSPAPLSSRTNKHAECVYSLDYSQSLGDERPGRASALTDAWVDSCRRTSGKGRSAGSS
jgi:hypothetical protein